MNQKCGKKKSVCKWKIKLAVYTCKRKKRFVSQLSLLTKPGYAVQYLNKRIWNLTYGAGYS